jgi:hypothetical protein
MNFEKILEYLTSYGAYVLGAFVYILDIIKKYRMLADASPNPAAVYSSKIFWKKENINVIQIFLYGVISTIILPRLFGGSIISIQNDSGAEIYSVPMRAALIPIQIILGWTGGRLVLAAMGRSKGELYRKIGVEENKNNDI